MEIKTNQIGDLLRNQIKNIDSDIDINEVGEVLEVGDGVYDINESWIEVEKIVKVDGEYQTYNFINMEYGTIIADGIVTHNSTTINSIGYFN